MILGTGIDIIEVARITKAIGRSSFIKRVFTLQEQAYCEGRGVQSAQSYAARFAGKEAVLKAFGTGLRGGLLTDIEILPDALGCPGVTLYGYFAAAEQQKQVTSIHISLTHTRQYAAAQVILWGDSK